MISLLVPKMRLIFCRPRTHQVLLVSQADGSSALWPNGNLQSGNVNMQIVTVPSLAIVPNFVATNSDQTHATSIVDNPTLPRRTTSLRQYPHKTSPNLSKREFQQKNLQQINANFFETQQNVQNGNNFSILISYFIWSGSDIETSFVVYFNRQTGASQAVSWLI